MAIDIVRERTAHFRTGNLTARQIRGASLAGTTPRPGGAAGWLLAIVRNAAIDVVPLARDPARRTGWPYRHSGPGRR
jgi:hypothetical protein